MPGRVPGGGNNAFGRTGSSAVHPLTETGKRAVAAGRATVGATRAEALELARNLAGTARSDPRGALAEFREALVQKWERVGPRASYTVTAEWERALHEWFGLPWPCPDAGHAAAIYTDVVATMRSQGMSLGPDAFVGWCDGDPALARAVYCVTTHLGAARVVETGVGRGITTRMVLEAQTPIPGSRLWSIELPPHLRPHMNDQLAAAVTSDLRARWEFILGSSRRRLPSLLVQLGDIDVFVHDSRHTTRNVTFEITLAWSRLVPGGVLLVDDVDLNSGVPAFLRTAGAHDVLFARSEVDNPARQGLFALIRKRIDTPGDPSDEG